MNFHSLIVTLVLLLLATGCTIRLEEKAEENLPGAPGTAIRGVTITPSDRVEETEAAANAASPQANVSIVAVSAQRTALRPATACSNRFIAHDLPHRTASTVERIGFFISNSCYAVVDEVSRIGFRR